MSCVYNWGGGGLWTEKTTWIVNLSFEENLILMQHWQLKTSNAYSWKRSFIQVVGVHHFMTYTHGRQAGVWYLDWNKYFLYYLEWKIIIKKTCALYNTIWLSYISVSQAAANNVVNMLETWIVLMWYLQSVFVCPPPQNKNSASCKSQSVCTVDQYSVMLVPHLPSFPPVCD